MPLAGGARPALHIGSWARQVEPSGLRERRGLYPVSPRGMTWLASCWNLPHCF